jgi:GH25 family lysozyme M1 (1,4-beta-N-acetylmuramidase)
MRPIALWTALCVALLAASPAAAQSADDRAWLLPDSILIIDPYEGNPIDWAKVKTDAKVKAMIHRAYFGTTPDSKYEAQVTEARQAGLLAGLYLLGRPGDPIKQADALIAAGKKTGVAFLALDIENLNPKKSMTIADAARFLEHVNEKTGRYPALYVNFSTYQHISQKYGKASAFAKAPLWVARFGPRHGMTGNSVWPTYAIWQFQSEINCAPCPPAYGGPSKACRKRADEVVVNEPCYRLIPGTKPDMDVNVFRGSEAELKALFGGG